MGTVDLLFVSPALDCCVLWLDNGFFLHLKAMVNGRSRFWIGGVLPWSFKLANPSVVEVAKLGGLVESHDPRLALVSLHGS